MTKKTTEEIKKIIARLENERKADKELWIEEHASWLGCGREKAENDYIKHLTFIDATLSLYKKEI